MYVACTICACLGRLVYACIVHNMRMLCRCLHVMFRSQHANIKVGGAGMQHAQYAHVRVVGCLGGCVRVSSCM